MQLTNYAIYGILLLRAIKKTGGPRNNAYLSRALGISPGYAAQITFYLRQAELLRSSKGRYGGFDLVPSAKYTYENVLEAMGSLLCPDLPDDEGRVQKVRREVRRLLKQSLKQSIW